MSNAKLLVVIACVGLGSCTFAQLQQAVTDGEITIPLRRQTLPEKCRPVYLNGTDDWINCMGVGYK